MIQRWCLILGVFLTGVAFFGVSIYYLMGNKPVYSHENDSRGYIVDSPNCKIVNYEPFHGSIQQYLGQYKLEACSNKPLLTTVTRTNGSHKLEIRNDSKQFYVNETDSLVCCYSIVRRTMPPYVQSDDDFTIGECWEFENQVTFSNDEEFLLVECESNTKENAPGNKIVYKNMHSFVRKSSETKKKVDDFQANNETLSIIMIGIDSMSRLNFKRTMPQMQLELSDWVELNGYNKIDINTYPNLIALLTGMNEESISDTCSKSYLHPLDDCAFLWKQLSKKNYVTLYTEDEPTDSSFNYDRVGFIKSPTDHYQRPFLKAADKELDKYPEFPFKRCYGPEYIINHIFNYTFEFMTEYKGHPQFVLMWMNTFSHYNVNGATAMDETYVTFFKKIKELGVFESSFIIFFSDHGIRFGDFRETYMGWLEERLPFIYLHLPDWWQKKNPEKYKNLKSNYDKLTSPYDLYLTIKDVMNETENGTISCPTCRSLFNPVSPNRLCENAGIPEEWCACEHHHLVDINGEQFESGAILAVESINKKLTTLNYNVDGNYVCATLVLKRVMKALKKSDDEIEEYLITFQTTPGDGIFEVNVKVNAIHLWFIEISKNINIVGDVSRINRYGNQSSCTHGNPIVKNYCFCIVKL